MDISNPNLGSWPEGPEEKIATSFIIVDLAMQQEILSPEDWTYAEDITECRRVRLRIHNALEARQHQLNPLGTHVPTKPSSPHYSTLLSPT
ncbi:hypothetical protein HGRIS_001294 [Hohenbuehelia grisea]|uniref:Uncharacterized protein n=1 Tax=Hohenbuehelia grisea TaxID=104357 RepID=A0ABR3IPH5_9AGAR